MQQNKRGKKCLLSTAVISTCWYFSCYSIFDRNTFYWWIDETWNYECFYAFFSYWSGTWYEMSSDLSYQQWSVFPIYILGCISTVCMLQLIIRDERLAVLTSYFFLSDKQNPNKQKPSKYIHSFASNQWEKSSTRMQLISMSLYTFAWWNCG